MAVDVAVLRTLLIADTKGYTTGLARADAQAGRFERNASRSFGKVGSAMTTLAKTGAAALGAGLAVGFTKAISSAVQFERGMRNVNSIAKLSDIQLRAVSTSALKLAGKVGQSPNTLAAGLYDLVSSGFDAKESMLILTSSAKAATAGLTDTATSTKAVAAVLNAYKRPAKDAAAVSDTLFQTVNVGVLTFEELASQIGDVLPFAASLGVDLKQVGGSIATMTKAGISAPETMTRIKAAMIAMIKPGKAMQGAFEELGVESGEALIKQKGFQGALDALAKTTGGSKAELAQLFPEVRGLGAALSLTGANARGARDDLKAFANDSGAASAAFAEQSKAVAFQWQRLKSVTTALGISIGSTLLPPLNAAARAVADFISQMQNGEGTGGRFASNITTAYNAVRTFASTTYNAVRAVTQSNAAMAALGAIVGGLAGRFVAIGIAAVVARFASLAASIRAAGGAMNFLTAAITRNPLGAIAVAVGAVAGAFGILSIRQRQVAVDADQVTAAFQRQRTAMQAVRDFSLDLKNVTLAYSQANLQVKSAVQQRTLAEQQFGQGSLQWQQANLQVKQSVIERTRAQRSLNDTEHEGTTRSRELTEATRSNIQTSRDRAQTVLDELVALQKQAATEGKTPARLAAIRDKQKQLSGAVRDYRDATGSARSANRLMQRSIANLGGDWSAFASFFADNVNDTLRKLGAKPLSFSRSNFNIATRISPRGDIDTVVSKPKASGGFLGGSGMRDTVPIMAAPGEAIVNRHQQRPIEHALRQTFGFGLNDLFRKESRPHYMARGGTATAVPQAGANKMAAAAKRYIGNISATMSGGATSTTGLVPQVRRALAFARKHGWSGGVSSGFRSREQQARLFNLFRQGKGNLAAPPGSSSHELGQAVDVTAAESFARAMGIAPSRSKLMRLVPGEPWHFSVSGHAKGGFVGMAGGGKIGASGIKNLWTRAGGSKKVATIMTAIALAESRGKTGATNRNTNGTIDKGLWQINSVHGFKGNLFSAFYNAKAAVSVFKKQGLGAWATYNNGAYKSFLDAASVKPKGQRRRRRGRGANRSGAAPRSIEDMQSAAREGLGRSIELANLRDQTAAVGGSDLEQARIGVSAAERGLSMAREFRDPVEIAQAELALAQARQSLTEAQNQPLVDAQNAAAEAAKAQAEAMAALTAEMKKARELGERTHNINVGEVNRMFMDWISGQLGGRGAASLRTLSRGAQYA